MTATTIDFESLVRTRTEHLHERMVVYGMEGTGKTSFVSRFPKPFGVLIGNEDGLDILIQNKLAPEVPHTPLLQTWSELMQWLDWLKDEPYETVFVDALTGVCDMAVKEILATVYRWDGTEPTMGKAMKAFTSFMEGWKPTKALWDKFLAKMQVLRESGKRVILVGHAEAVKYKNPKDIDYVRFQARLGHQDIWAKTKEWADVVLFFDYNDAVTDANEFFKIGKGKGGRQRVCHTERTAAFDAKNRQNLPPMIMLGKNADEAYAAFTKAWEAK